MKSPLTGKEMLLKRESRVLTFRKEEFSVVYHYYLLCSEYIDYLFNGEFPDEFSGYRKPNLVKLAEMVVFFTAQLNP